MPTTVRLKPRGCVPTSLDSSRISNAGPPSPPEQVSIKQNFSGPSYVLNTCAAKRRCVCRMPQQQHQEGRSDPRRKVSIKQNLSQSSSTLKERCACRKAQHQQCRSHPPKVASIRHHPPLVTAHCCIWAVCLLDNITLSYQSVTSGRTYACQCTRECVLHKNLWVQQHLCNCMDSAEPLDTQGHDSYLDSGLGGRYVHDMV